MNLSAIKNVATARLGRAGLVIQKHSPAILTTVGIIGTVTSTVMTARATLKLEDTVTQIQDNLEAANALVEDELRLKAKTVAYTVGVKEIVKLYGPSVTLGVASIGCLVGAQGIMHKRNVALAAAYKTLEEGFNKYRNRVRDELGEEKDFEFLHGKMETVKLKNAEGKDEEVKVQSEEGPSMYAKFFDELNPNWVKDSDYNLFFLRAQQSILNDQLRARGHVFLNEVYDTLGIERTQAGSVVGWLYGQGGDDFIDFGIYDADNERRRMFVNGDERSILLDFNVDGTIFDKI